MKNHKLRNSVLFLLVFSLVFPSLAFAQVKGKPGKDKASKAGPVLTQPQEQRDLWINPKTNQPYPMGWKIPTPEEIKKIKETTLRPKRVHLNNMGLERVNEARKSKGLQPLPKGLTVKRGMEIEGSIGETDEEAARTKTLTKIDRLFLDNLPASVDNSQLKYFPPIGSQGSLPTCVPFSVVYYGMTHMWAFANNLDAKNGGDAFRLSPKWAYNMVNNGHNDGSGPPYGVGINHGIATWQEFPYDDDWLAWCLDPLVWRNAISRRFLAEGTIGYLNTDEGMAVAKQMLVDGYVLNFGSYPFAWQSKGISNDPSTPADEPFVGQQCVYNVDGPRLGHFLTLVGYNDDIWVDINGDGAVQPNEKGAFKIANSWDTWWGNGGYIWASYEAARSGGSFFQAGMAHFVIPRPAYSPRIICEFKVNHQKRNQLKVSLGISDLNQGLPAQEWGFAMIANQGGPYPFYGVFVPPPDPQDPYDGTFAFDFTDLWPVDPSEHYFYLITEDNDPDGYPAALKECYLYDPEQGIRVPFDYLPTPVDGGRGYAYIRLYTPHLNSLSPTQGRAGSSLVINGSGFGAGQGIVKFGATGASIISWSDTAITCAVPEVTPDSYSVTVTTLGGTSNAVNFTVLPSPPPSITSLNPLSRPANGNVTITGTNFGDNRGTSAVKFGTAGAIINSWSNSSITCAVPEVAVGSYPVTVTTIGGTSNVINFTVLSSAPPAIALLNQPLGPANSSMIIAGANFGDNQGTSTVKFGTATAVVSSWSNTAITCVVPDVTVGPHFVIVTTTYGTSNAADFTVIPYLPPSIISFNPTSGLVNSSVTISGINFGVIRGTSTVRFGSVPANITSWSNTQIKAAVPNIAPGAYPVTVTTVGGTSNFINFTIVPPQPTITSLNPGSGALNSNVTIIGANFGDDRGISAVKFGSRVATISSWSSTAITCVVPEAAAGSYSVVVATAGGTSNTFNFTVLPSAAPAITSIDPGSGAFNSNVTITGANFGDNQGTSAVKFGSRVATISSWSSSVITCLAPEAVAGPYSVTVTTTRGTSNAVNFTVSPSAPPQIQELWPDSAYSSPYIEVGILGANFGDNQGTSIVKLGTTCVNITQWYSDLVCFTIPPSMAPGVYLLTVTTVNGISNAVNFTVEPGDPMLDSINPAQGPVGTTVTLTGRNFGVTQGSHVVKFGSTIATVSSWSQASVTCLVPDLPVGGYYVNFDDYLICGPIFTVIPSISGVSSGSGPVGTSVTITGTNFGASQGSSTVEFGSTVAGITSWSNQAITCVVPNIAIGAYSITMVNPAYGRSNAVNFMVTGPRIDSINPVRGPAGTTVTIAGRNFGAVSGRVLFFSDQNYFPAITSWSDTSITCTVGNYPNAGYRVFVYDASGSAAGNSGNLIFEITSAPPSISSLSATSGYPQQGFVISGSGFGIKDPNRSKVSFTCNAVTLYAAASPWTDNSITCIVPFSAPEGTYQVRVINGMGSSNAKDFKVIRPVITKFRPSSRKTGESFIIEGRGFGATKGIGSVNFEDTPASTGPWGDTSITCTVPSGVSKGTHTVTVTAASGDVTCTSTPQYFTVK